MAGAPWNRPLVNRYLERPEWVRLCRLHEAGTRRDCRARSTGACGPSRDAHPTVTYCRNHTRFSHSPYSVSAISRARRAIERAPQIESGPHSERDSRKSSPSLPCLSGVKPTGIYASVRGTRSVRAFFELARSASAIQRTQGDIKSHSMRGTYPVIAFYIINQAGRHPTLRAAPDSLDFRRRG